MRLENPLGISFNIRGLIGIGNSDIKNRVLTGSPEAADKNISSVACFTSTVGISLCCRGARMDLWFGSYSVRLLAFKEANVGGIINVWK